MIAMLLWLACRTAAPLDDLGEVPAFTLRDQTGAPVTRAEMLGYVWVADFMFTSCPDVCPTLSTRMSGVQAHFRDEPRLRIFSFSVDPETDTPEVLHAYAARFGGEAPRWRFLTGPVDDMKKVVVSGFKQLMEKQPPVDGEVPNVLHGSRFVVGDTRAHIRAFPDPRLPGEVEAAVERLLRE